MKRAAPRPMTDLERVVAERLKKSEDPWAGRHGVGSRSVSGALGRLQHLGYAQYVWVGDHSNWELTKEGLKALEEKKP